MASTTLVEMDYSDSSLSLIYVKTSFCIIEWTVDEDDPGMHFAKAKVDVTICGSDDLVMVVVASVGNCIIVEQIAAPACNEFYWSVTTISPWRGK